MKRGIFRTSVAVFLVMMLVGCAELPDITDQQGNLVAEYAGGVLLRYSSKYAYRLVKNDADEDGVEDSATDAASGAAATMEPLASPEASASPSPEPGASAGPDATSDPNASEAPEESVAPEPTEEPSVSLDELYHIKGLKFSYVSSSYSNRYPSSDDAIEITAPADKVLYIVNFKVKNTGSKAIRVNLTGRPFHYELSVGGDTALPTLSLLPNGGLNYLMTTIKPGKTEKASLIFNLDRDKKGTKGNTLSITEGEKTAVIEL